METAAGGAREDEVELLGSWKGELYEDAFAKLSEADLGYAAHAAANSVGLEPSQRQEQPPPTQQRPRHDATATTQRFKRKNFSKTLQLLSLQRYAQYARDFGRLPDKNETQQLLQQSYLQFLKEGGAPDEPRLTYAEFLKLIRNRRREINVRAQRPQKQSKEGQVTPRRMAVLTPAKRKLQEEHTKIRDLIEVIDRTREQAGLIPDPQQNRRLRPQQSVVAQGHSQQQQHQTAVEMVMVPPPPMMESLPPLPPDPMEQIEAILQIHQETREVQREIVARLRSISRVMNQHEGHGEEPSSASV
ncbi:hypothetical protein PHYSODRAFT_480235 [Phytophthora sojae]|uniref:Uncharacterized protein n=1 Tax=Phytophthora sojae (strain P6497) TaxID=1094619 RepID=G4Z175_PHYSP|nr:hypothetical protein PHYSODRAFT_480235 [Phytophthora sojae]EGZ24694.1 hypothetical protein PHYSODRAFT_480235 [Phytophthora sojae]|eukprot:XP_009519982.1 hypothetical protein PHYSODRAFT_480235 [Phytophthora sojae]